MAVAVLFEMPGATQEQYDEVVQKLEDAGEGTPPGRVYHVSGPTEAGWRVVDVWESQEQFDKFGQTLMPFLEEVGFPDFEPEFWDVHDQIVG